MSLELSDYQLFKSVSVQTDGTLLILAKPVGNDSSADDHIRLESDGRLVSNFGTAGKAKVTDERNSTLQPDGQIVVAGYSANTTQLFRFFP